MSTYGLIGKRLGHSQSPKYFNDKFREEGLDHHYEIFELPTINGFKGLVKGIEDLGGFNVTIPYKEKIVPLLDKLDKTASEVGAVNTIALDKGKLVGHNTDVIGFKKSILELIGKERPAALVLGSGGSCKAICSVLEKLDIAHQVVSRSARKGDLLWREVTAEVVKEHHLIINTTPLGMWPKLDVAPMLPYSKIKDKHFLLDLIYNPVQTEFLLKGHRNGAKTMNGKMMLEAQAEASWKIWNGAKN